VKPTCLHNVGVNAEDHVSSQQSQSTVELCPPGPEYAPTDLHNKESVVNILNTLMKFSQAISRVKWLTWLIA
jgi:hypothetical protein